MLRFYRGLTRLFAAIVIARFISWAVLVFFVAQDRDDVTFPEGARVYALRRVSAGEPLYQDFRRVPHVMVPYGPLYFEVAGGIDRWLGGDVFDSYLVGRLVSVTCFVGVMLLVGIWAGELARNRWLGAVIGLYAAGCPTLFGPSVGTQVDSMAVLAILAALFVASRAWGEWRWGCVWMLALVAWATKQNSIALVPAVGVWLFTARGLRAAAIWTCAWLAGVAALWGFLDWQTGGLFTLNAFVSLKRPLIAQFGLRVLSRALPFIGIATVGSLAGWRGAVRSESSRLVAWWFVFAAIQGSLSCFGEGGGANYLMEPWIAACLLIARVVPVAAVDQTSDPPLALETNPSSRPSPLSTGEREKGVAFMSAGMFALLKTLWMLLVIVGCIHDISLYYMWNIVRHAQYYAHTPSAARAAEMMPTLERVVRTHAGPVFVPHAFLANMSRQPPIVLDVVHYRLMVDGGIISADELVGRLTRREFALIILRERLEPHFNANSFTRWPEAVWSAMLQNYEYLGDVDGQSVYATKVE